MKRQFTFLVLVFSIVMIGKAQWTQGFFFSANLSLIKSVHFSGPGFGFATATGNGGPEGYLLKSTDGGANWAVNYSTPAGAAGDVHFPPGQTTVGYASGRYVYKTTNAGTSWDTIYRPVEDCGPIVFTSTTEGYMAGAVNSGFFWKTTDGGSTWNPMTLPVSFRVHQVQFMNSTNGYAAGGDIFSGGDGTIIKTTDAGASWQELDYTPALGGNPTAGFDGMYWLNQNVGFVGGQTGIMVKTTDGGQNWTQVATSDPDSSSITDIWFTSAGVGFYSTILGKIFTSNNGGASWTLNATNQGGFALYCLEFADANNGFAGGLLGTYLSTTNAGGSVAIDPSAFPSVGLDIVPNPSNGNFKIQTLRAHTTPVDIRVADLSGRIVFQSTIPASALMTGHDIALAVPSGVYAMTIHADNQQKTARLVVQH